ncbi:hypothetical protein TrLO_g8583 [Triparma laevis f. longispina]|uniref:Phosphodiesterase n=1 Tax=Triparma laevis f. longispina TaxID=1714387 RepID=A0A9W7AG04_9STRA|nr:hypothetical protein TrLO_g8583 [Triparma laevis f. longispina]
MPRLSENTAARPTKFSPLSESLEYITPIPPSNGVARPGGRGSILSANKNRRMGNGTSNNEKVFEALRVRSLSITNDYNEEASVAIKNIRQNVQRGVSRGSSIKFSRPSLGNRSRSMKIEHGASMSTRRSSQNTEGAKTKPTRDLISMPLDMLTNIIDLLQDNSSEISIKESLDFICSATATELECEKVDLLIVSKPTKTMIPMCQMVNLEGPLGAALAEKVDVDEDHISFEDKFKEQFAHTFEGERVSMEDGAIWDRCLKTRQHIFSDDENSVQDLVGEEFIEILDRGMPMNFKLNSLLAVPVMCTRTNEHIVGVLLCQNKIAPGHFSAEEAEIPEQFSHFAGIAISSLEMMVEAQSKQLKLGHLVDTIASLSTNENVGSQVRRLYEKTSKLVGSDDLTLYIMNQSSNSLKVAHSTERLSLASKTITINDKTLAGVVAMTGKQAYASAGDNTTGSESVFNKLLEANETSCLCVPVMYQGKVEAVVKAVNHSLNSTFDLDDLDLIAMLGKSTGILIHQSHILKDAMSAARLADATGRLISSATSPWATLEDILAEVKKDCQRLVPSEVTTMFFLDYNRKELWGVLDEKSHASGTDVFRLNFGLGLAGKCAEKNEVIVTGDATLEKGWFKKNDEDTGFKTRSMVSIPIMGPATGAQGEEETVVAVLQVINKQDMENNIVAFADEDVVILKNYASKVGSVLRNKLQDFTKQKLEMDVRHEPKDDISRTMLSIAKEYTAKNIDISQNRHSAMRKLSEKMFLSNSSRALMLASNPGTIDENGPETEKSPTAEKRKTEADYRRSSTLTGLDNRERLFQGSLEGLNPNEIAGPPVSAWAFNVIDLSPLQCEAYVYFLLEQFGLVESLKLNQQKTSNFIGTVLNSYRKVDYHNIHHATQVVHQTGWMLLRAGCDDLRSLGLLIAALAHDVDHPGNNNAFEASSESELAIRYSYDRILERHHSATALRILSKEHCNLLDTDTLTSDDVKKIKMIIVNAILATDMNIHTSLLADVDALPKHAFENIEGTSSNKMDALMATIIHTADLSTNCLALETAKTWGERCLAEFKHQASKEKELGLPITPFMAQLETESEQAKTQYGFCAFVIRPWFTAISKLTIFDMTEAMHNLGKVIRHYDYLRQQDVQTN